VHVDGYVVGAAILASAVGIAVVILIAAVAALTLTIACLLKRCKKLLNKLFNVTPAAAALRILALAVPLLAQKATDGANHACHVSSPLTIKNLLPVPTETIGGRHCKSIKNVIISIT
jgi:hypothetical protein